MRCLYPVALMLLLAACADKPRVAWPDAAPATPPPLLPLSEITPPPTGPDPGPALQARADALRAALGIAP